MDKMAALKFHEEGERAASKWTQQNLTVRKRGRWYRRRFTERRADLMHHRPKPTSTDVSVFPTLRTQPVRPHLQSNQKEDNTTLKTVNLTAQSLKGQEGFTVKMNFSQNALTCDRVLTETSPRKSSLSHMINITNGQTIRGLENCNICWKRTVWRPHKSLGAGVLIICRRRKNRKIGEEKRK